MSPRRFTGSLLATMLVVAAALAGALAGGAVWQYGQPPCMVMTVPRPGREVGGATFIVAVEGPGSLHVCSEVVEQARRVADDLDREVQAIEAVNPGRYDPGSPAPYASITGWFQRAAIMKEEAVALRSAGVVVARYTPHSAALDRLHLICQKSRWSFYGRISISVYSGMTGSSPLAFCGE